MSKVGLIPSGFALDEQINILCEQYQELLNTSSVIMAIYKQLNKYISYIKFIHKQRYKRTELLNLAAEYFINDDAQNKELANDMHWYPILKPYIDKFIIDVCSPEFMPKSKRYNSKFAQSMPLGYYPVWNIEELDITGDYELIDDFECITYPQFSKSGFVLSSLITKSEYGLSKEQILDIEQLLNECIKWSYAIIHCNIAQNQSLKDTYSTIHALRMQLLAKPTHTRMHNHNHKKTSIINQINQSNKYIEKYSKVLVIVRNYYINRLKIEHGDVNELIISYCSNIIRTATKSDCSFQSTLYRYY